MDPNKINDPRDIVDDAPKDPGTPMNLEGSASDDGNASAGANNPADPKDPTNAAPDKNPNPRAPLPRDTV